MAKLKCCYLRNNDDACDVNDMAGLHCVLTTICILLFIGSFLLFFLFFTVYACQECPTHGAYQNRTLLRYNTTSNKCQYNDTIGPQRRVMDSSCQIRVFIGVSIGVTTIILITLFCTMVFCRSCCFYDWLSKTNCCGECNEESFCIDGCFHTDSTDHNYPDTDRCGYNMKVLAKSIIFGLIVIIIVITLPITLPIGSVALLIGAVALLIYGIGYGLYILWTMFCPYTCDVCTYDITVAKEKKDGYIQCENSTGTAV